MSGGISNEEVIKFFENVEDNDIKENCRCFPIKLYK